MWNAVDADDPAGDAAAAAENGYVLARRRRNAYIESRQHSLSLSLSRSLARSLFLIWPGSGDVCTQLPWRMKK